jgi:hypothetical protein
MTEQVYFTDLVQSINAKIGYVGDAPAATDFELYLVTGYHIGRVVNVSEIFNLTWVLETEIELVKDGVHEFITQPVVITQYTVGFFKSANGLVPIEHKPERNIAYVKYNDDKWMLTDSDELVESLFTDPTYCVYHIGGSIWRSGGDDLLVPYFGDHDSEYSIHPSQIQVPMFLLPITHLMDVDNYVDTEGNTIDTSVMRVDGNNGAQWYRVKRGVDILNQLQATVDTLTAAGAEQQVIDAVMAEIYVPTPIFLIGSQQQ